MSGKRDRATGQIKGIDVGGDVDNIAGKNILIVDDICSKGGTFYFSAKKLKELGAKNIYLHITHCENTIFEGEAEQEEIECFTDYDINKYLRGPELKEILEKQEENVR